MKKITLQDIADELGVSKGTVDRAIHNRSDINPETREKVLELIEKYNYRPDRVARSLSLKSRKIKIGYILPQDPSFFWRNVIKGIDVAGKELDDFGLEIIYSLHDKGRNSDEILKKVDNLLEKNVNAIAMVPVNSIDVKSKIDTLCENGIPVATINDDISDSKRVFYVGPQMIQNGRVAGELMGKFLGGQGRVMTLNGDIQSLEYKERLEGFAEVLREDYKGIRIVANYTYSQEELRTGNTKIIKSMLESSDDINGIYDADGATLYTLGQLIKSISKPEKPVIIGHEIWRGVKELIEEGVVDAAISQDPYSQGYFMTKLLFGYVSDKKIPDFDRMFTRLDIIMKENMVVQDNIINPYYIDMI